MIFRIFLLNSLLSTSVLFASDRLSREQQNDEIERAFFKSKRLETLQGDEIPDTEKEEDDTIFIEQSETMKQSFPAASDILTKQDHIMQQAQKNIPSSLPTITREDFLKIEKAASQTIFHNINDALNYLLTSKGIITSLLSKNPNLIRLTLLELMGYSEDEIDAVYFPLESIDHPVADLAQNYIVLKEFQYWIDVLYIIKKIIFPTDSVNSYNHNKAVAMKEFIKQNGAGLTDMVAKELELRSKYFQYLYNNSDHELSLFLNTQKNFYFALQNLMYKIADVLPDSTISFVSMGQARKSRKKIKNMHGKNVYNEVVHKLSGDMRDLNFCFSQNLTGIFSIIRSHAMVDGLEMLHPEDQSTVLNSLSFTNATTTKNQTPASYRDLFTGITNNIKSIQGIRQRLNLPTKIFDGKDLKNEFFNALRLYEESKKIVIDAIPADTKIEDTPAETKIDDMAPLNDEQDVSSSVVSHEETENTEDDYIYDTDYFKRIHDFHQKLKQSEKKSSRQQQQRTFSDFELELYQFMNEMIYHPFHRPTWSGLITDLDYFGFKGEPNRSGNGSTWVFSVTDRNELFYNDDYRQATFNVHEFKGNEPIHPKYLKFFQSGLSNVFGLTEEYITEALNKHAEQQQRNKK